LHYITGKCFRGFKLALLLLFRRYYHHVVRCKPTMQSDGEKDLANALHPRTANMNKTEDLVQRLYVLHEKKKLSGF
jgi:hypothetical protein